MTLKGVLNSLPTDICRIGLMMTNKEPINDFRLSQNRANAEVVLSSMMGH